MIARAAVAALCLLATAGPAVTAPLDVTDARDLVLAGAEPALTLEIGDRRPVGDIASTFVMPGARVTLRARETDDGAEMVLQTAGQGVIEDQGADRWVWRAPTRPGLYTLTVYDRQRASRMRVHVFVKTPFDHSQRTIDGFRVGRYESEPLRGNSRTAPPAGLIRVTEANRDTPVSEHFTLGDFLCHQQPAHWPKYVLVQPRLLDKLERLHAALADAGFDKARITVMSGYRTPWYNADIGNTTVYSQHLFGGAADVFVDNDGNGRMDDLNEDGRVDTADARWLADLVETVTAEHPDLVGGLSAYAANAYHGPFVHLDVRGVAARW